VSRRRPSRRRILTVAVCMALAVATLTAVSAISAPTAHGPSAVGAAPVCVSDGSGGCTATLPCKTGPCPSVDVAPAGGLNDGQFVFVRATGFTSGGSLRIALCSNNSSATDPSCLVGMWESEQRVPVQTPVTVDPTHNNLTQIAYPAFFDQSGEGNLPLPSHDILNVNGMGPGFYCDNTADICSLMITKEAGTGSSVGNGPPVTPNNTAVIPLNFAAQGNGCPAGATQIQTDSSYSVEHFMPAAVDSTCSGAGGVVALNTATDNRSVVSDFNAGGTDLAFIDNPGDLTQEGLLFGGRQFAYIPVAVSATVVSMLAGETVGNSATPIANYNLTPNMVAGIITTGYSGAVGNVNFNPPSLYGNDYPNLPIPCTNLVLCKGPDPITQLFNELHFSAFNLLNPPTASGVGVYMPNSFGDFNSNVPSGSSYQATDWFCHAPTVPYKAAFQRIKPAGTVTVKVTDQNLAAQTFTAAPQSSSVWPPPNNPTESWIFPNCLPYSTFPALSSETSTYGEFQSPELQAHNMRNFAFGGNTTPSVTTNPTAAFGVMDSSESSFNGLYTANLQNAGGNFVSPTANSIDAALANVTPCPAGNLTCPLGTYQVNYSAKTPTAYPMPNITYAMVPTAPLPPTKAAALKDLLTNLVSYSHNGGSLPLPNGYAPLSTPLYQAALADIAKDVVSQPGSGPSAPGGGGSSTKGSGGPGGTTGGSSTGSTNPFASTAGQPAGAASLPLSTTSPTAGDGSHPRDSGVGGTGGLGTATGFILVGLDAAARYLLPALVILAIACLIFGPLLLFAPRWRRREPQAGDQQAGEPPGDWP
jgi:hypothetical protein